VLLAALGYNAYNFVNTGLGQDDMLADAIRYAEEALRRDPGSLDAHRLKGAMALSLQGSVRTAIEELQFVLSKSPEDTETAWWCSLALSFVGRTAEAAELSLRIRKLDPLNSNGKISHAWTFFMEGRFDEAVEAIRGEFDHDPNMFSTFSYGQALIHAGRWEEMDRLAGRLRADLGSAPLYKLILAQHHAHKGDRAAVEALVDDDLMKTVNRDFQYPWQLAVAWLMLGERGRALHLLGDAVSRGFWNYRFLGEFDPYTSPLRGDPRFDALLERAEAEAKRI
jgi:tetratricopeptide (TPR) repeat protein